MAFFQSSQTRLRSHIPIEVQQRAKHSGAPPANWYSGRDDAPPRVTRTSASSPDATGPNTTQSTTEASAALTDLDLEELRQQALAARDAAVAATPGPVTRLHVWLSGIGAKRERTGTGRARPARADHQ